MELQWYNSEQSKIERDQLIQVLLTDKRMTKADKKRLKDIRDNDQNGIFYVDVRGNSRPAFTVPTKESVPIRVEVKAPKQELRETPEPSTVVTNGTPRVVSDRKIKKIPGGKGRPGLDREQLREKEMMSTYLKAIKFKMRSTGDTETDKLLDRRNKDIEKLKEWK